MVKEKSITNISDTISTNGGLKEYEINVAETGYTAIGIVRISKWGAGQGRSAIGNYYLSGNTAYVDLVNGTLDTSTITAIFITVLYRSV